MEASAMIDWRDPDGRSRRGVTVLSATRWTLAAAAVVAAHVVAPGSL
jgi:hypothetical protein